MLFRVLLKRYFECCLRLFEGCFEVVWNVALRLLIVVLSVVLRLFEGCLRLYRVLL